MFIQQFTKRHAGIFTPRTDGINVHWMVELAGNTREFTYEE